METATLKGKNKYDNKRRFLLGGLYTASVA